MAARYAVGGVGGVPGAIFNKLLAGRYEDARRILMEEHLPQRVLVVDDEECLAQALSQYLECVGYLVKVCRSAREARRVVDWGERGFDLALVDQQLGTESGDLLVRYLLDTIPAIRIALMSGMPMEPEQLPACDPERLVFLQKPFRPADVAQCLKNLSETQPGK